MEEIYYTVSLITHHINVKTKPPGDPAVFNIIPSKYLIKEAEIVRNIKQQRADVVIDLK